MRERDKHRSLPEVDSIITPALDVWYSCTAYIDVQYIILPPPYFLSGSTPLHTSYRGHSSRPVSFATPANRTHRERHSNIDETMI